MKTITAFLFSLLFAGAAWAQSYPSRAVKVIVPGYDAAAWIGYAAPAGTPREPLARLVSLGLDARSSTPEEMGAFLKREQERYGSIIKSQNIKVEP